MLFCVVTAMIRLWHNVTTAYANPQLIFCALVTTFYIKTSLFVKNAGKLQVPVSKPAAVYLRYG